MSIGYRIYRFVFGKGFFFTSRGGEGNHLVLPICKIVFKKKYIFVTKSFKDTQMANGFLSIHYSDRH